jgi:hypothetical protein
MLKTAVLLADNTKFKLGSSAINNGFSARMEWLNNLRISDFHASMEAKGN